MEEKSEARSNRSNENKTPLPCQVLPKPNCNTTQDHIVWLSLQGHGVVSERSLHVVPSTQELFPNTLIK